MKLARNLGMWSIATAMLFLTACGGGGGSDKPAAPSPSFSIAKNSITFTAPVTGATPVSQTVTGSILNVNSNIYLRVDIEGTAVMDAGVAVTGTTTGTITITPYAPGDLGVGTYASTITVHASLDAAGNNQIPGSPKTINVTYTVTDAPGVTAGSELLLNGDFSDGTTHWNAYTQNGAAGSFALEQGLLHYAITTVGANYYDVQLQYLGGFSCILNKQYRLSFEARADATKTISTTINENGHDLDGNGINYSAHAYKEFTISTIKATYTLDFTMPVTNNDAGLLFLIGADDSDLYIDNVSFKEIITSN